MAQRFISSGAMAIFVVRIWCETSAGEPRWRGQIEHVQSKEHVAFLEWDTMLRFLRRFGVDMEDRRRSA
jgi:hypothetical protein